MSPYAAPLMQFAIEELAGPQALGGISRFSEYNPQTVSSVLEQAAKFVAGVLEPLNRSGDREGSPFSDGRVMVPRGFEQAYRQFTASGWNGLSSDPVFGG